MTSDMAVFLFVVFGLLVYPVCIKGQTLCDTDGILEVAEKAGTNVFTCTGIDSRYTVGWILKTSSDTTLAQCSPHPMACSNNFSPSFTASRPVSDTSTLTLDSSTTILETIRGQTIICKQTVGTVSSQQAECRVDVVAIPSVTCDAHYNTGTSSPWTVTVNCGVSGAYSYLNRYTCQLVQTSPSTKNLGSVNMTMASTSWKYKSGTCEITVPYPDATGAYSYKMVVTPGRQNVNAMFGDQSTFTIRRPSTQPSHTCPQYVQESYGVSCTCTATDLGQPSGVVRWTSTGTNQLSLANVQRQQDGEEYICEVMWNRKRVQSVKYTLRVAYGPSSVSISQPSSPFDTDGQQQLTLTCSSDSNPAPTFTWRKGSNSNIIGQGNTYTFTPRAGTDDNSMFVCQAANPATGASQQDTVTLTLNYPPIGNPVITASTASGNQGPFYQGDRVTLTCSTAGGKPFSATKLTFTCPGKQDRPDSVGFSGVSSTVTFDSLTAADHNKVCTCTTRWKNKNWYNRIENITLLVNSPPSSPVISKPSNYPFIATVTQAATLTCHSTSPGVPASTYTWTITQGGREGTDAQGRGTLTFDTVRKELNGENVRCRASNRFIDNRRRVPDAELMLEIYYKPEITFEPVEGTNPNQCEFTSSDKSQCVVTEGQRVHVRCSASSNPSPEHIAWQGTSGTNPDLLIESANHTQHSGVYNCSVTTGRGNHGDDNRLPLKGFKSFTVLVPYPPSISSFEVNSSSSTTLTVNASDVLDLSCRAAGRPSPQTTLIHPNTSLIPVTPQGSTSRDETSVVSGKLIAQCRDTGIYTCNVDNAVGSAQQEISIFVQCKPEDAACGCKFCPVNFRGEAVHLSCTVTAYPVPWLKEVKFFKQQPTSAAAGQDPRTGIVAVNCSSNSIVSSDVICQVSVDNVKSTDAGFYQAVIGNGFGDLKLHFEIKVDGLAAVQWNPLTQTKNATRVCLGTDVTLGWNYTLAQGEAVDDIKWFFAPSATNTPTIIATSVYGAFIAVPPYGPRLTYLDGGVVELSGVTAADVGTYTVEIISRGTSGSFSTIRRHLDVFVEDTSNSSHRVLTVTMDKQAVPDANGELHVKLKCGPLAWRGEPPVDVVWKTPSGTEMSSTGYEHDTFFLLLNNPVENGAYTCTLPVSALHAICLDVFEPLTASISVDGVSTRLTLLEARENNHTNELQQMKGENLDLTQQLQRVKGEMDQYREQLRNLTNHLHSVEGDLDKYRNMSSAHVAFHAVLDRSSQVNSSHYVVFNHVAYNDGKGYDSHSGVFTAPMTGSYFFAATISPYDLGRYSLMAKGSEMARIDVHTPLRTRYDLYTMHATIHLAKGSKVWVKSLNNGHIYYWSLFSGFLIRPDL